MRKLMPFIAALLIVSACSSIDCPLNNVVYAKYILQGDVRAIPGELTVSTRRADGRDTVILDALSDAADFVLPISYIRPTEVLFFQLRDSNSVLHYDTVTYTKTDMPHFESVDCGPNFFHKLTGVTWTKQFIDSIIISKSTVNYDTTGGNVQIYLKPGL